MSIFGKILSGLGINRAKAEQSPQPPQTKTPEHPTAGSSDNLDNLLKQASAQNQQELHARQSAPASQNAIGSVDVAAKLDELQKNSGQTLNWKTSIVDLLKLLGLDSSLESRKTLAQELNCPADKLSDSAQLNIWLHKQVMQKLAENGGQVPPELR